MMYPPNIQQRLANVARLSREEQARLFADMHGFEKNEIAVHGRLRHDAYPNLPQWATAPPAARDGFFARIKKRIITAVTPALT